MYLEFYAALLRAPDALQRFSSGIATRRSWRRRREYLGGFAVVDVADEEAAWPRAGKIAAACGWPQEVRRFRVPAQLPETS